MNILYLDENINYYSAKLNSIITGKPYKNMLKNGLIIDQKKFFKCFSKMLKDNGIKSGIIPEKILIITPPIFYPIYKYLYKQIFENLNYREIVFESEKDFYKLGKNNVILNYQPSYFYISYLENGKLKSSSYSMNDKILEVVLKEFKDIEIFIYGDVDTKISELLDKYNVNYYIYLNENNYFINKCLE